MHAADDRFGPAAEGAAYFAVAGLPGRPGPGRPPASSWRVRRDIGGPDGPVLVVELVGVDVRHAEAMLEQVWRLGGTIDRTRETGIGTITVRIPCE